MTVSQEIIASLIPTDIVAWNGVLSHWGAIKEYICSGDLIRLADEDEVFSYRRQQQKQEIIKHRHSIIHHEREVFGVSGPYELLMNKKLHYSGWRNQVAVPYGINNISPLIQLEYDPKGYTASFSYYTSTGNVFVTLRMEKEFLVDNSHQFISCIKVFFECLPENAATKYLVAIWNKIIEKYDTEKGKVT